MKRHRLVALLVLPVLCLAASDWPSPRAFDFVHDVLPVLQQRGCASAYCHGSATGQGGFKLSLFGSDPRADYFAITRDLDGRRLDLLHPEQSLVVAKPTLGMRHGGGRRLERGSDAHGRLLTWIAAGAPYRTGASGTLTDLAMETRGSGVRAVAKFTGGDAEVEERDVTALTMFSSTDERVTQVDGEGRVTMVGPGEAWILARYGNQNARLAVRQPFAGRDVARVATAPSHSDATAPARSDATFDDVWLARLAQLGLQPAATAPRPMLARRLWLDLAGRPPSLAELRTFLALPPDEAVASTADRLLAGPGFAPTFAAHLARWFELPQEAGTARLHAELTAALGRGDSLIAIARRLLQSRQLVARLPDPRDRAELVGRALLGVRVGCARCHDHPHDRWRQDDHLAFSAFFADPRPSPGGGAMVDGLLFDPRDGAAIAPRLLPVGAAPPPGERSQAQQVAWFVLDADHGLFARNMSNRIFATLLGEGLVEPIDDHRLSNPARHEALLEALQRAFTACGGDLRALVRVVVTSRLYATSSEEPVANSADDASRTEAEAAVHFMARRQARAMPAPLLRASIAAVLGVELPGELRVPDAPLGRQLALLNGPLLRAALGGGGCATTVDAILDFGDSAASQLEDLYRTILSRPPTAAEREAFAAVFDGDDRKTKVHDLALALLASREFGSMR